MVAEIIAIKAILEKKQRVLYIVPYVSIVYEKSQYLSSILKSIDVKVEGLHSLNDATWSPYIDIAVCTIEKANSVFNMLLEEQAIKDIGLIIIDEFHVLLEQSRGYLIESIVAKCKTIEKVYSHSIRIVAMSATLKKIELLRDWLNATLVECGIRPVPLTEYIVIGETLYDKELKRITPIPRINNKYSDIISTLAQYYLASNESIIIFCPTKASCENHIPIICRYLQKCYQSTINSELPIYEKFKERLEICKGKAEKDIMNQRETIIDELKSTSVGICPLLNQSIPYGIAYHNSDLTSEERVIIEKAFRNGVIKVLLATSTISTGINLPAKAVFFKSLQVEH